MTVCIPFVGFAWLTVSGLIMTSGNLQFTGRSAGKDLFPELITRARLGSRLSKSRLCDQLGI